MENLFKKFIYSLFLFLSFSALSSCGDPYYWGDVVVTEEVEVVSVVDDHSQKHATFRVQWDYFSPYDDVHVSLITPFNDYIEEGGPTIDGCYFSGTYQISSTTMESLIVCDEPLYGYYDLKIENLGGFTQNVSIDMTQETQTYHGVYQDITHQHALVGSGDIYLTSFLLN